MAEVTIEKLTKSYDGSVKVLDGVDLHINQGELVFLLETPDPQKSRCRC